MKYLKPPHLFPNVNPADFKWSEHPIKARILNIDAQGSESLRRAMNTDLTKEFISTLYMKATHRPPENISVEIKGETRSGKSSAAIFLGKLISYWWGKKFTVDNILPNQSVFLERVRGGAELYGETFVVDEQTQEVFGEGTEREHAQLSMILNICAKRCINVIFIYPPSFLNRNAPFGLETCAKDIKSRHNKLWYHDLSKKGFGFGGVYPRGYVILPKYQDKDYQKLPMKKWSERRKKNFEEKEYDFDSELEENYEAQKDSNIDQIAQNLDTGYKEKKKLEIAEQLFKNDVFMKAKSDGKKAAYIKMMVARGEIMEFTMSEVDTIVNMVYNLKLENE